VFSGKFDQADIQDTPVKIENQYAEIITNILPDWDASAQRCKVPFHSVEQYIIKDGFDFNIPYNGAWNTVEVRIDSLPVEPYNADDALIWRNCLLNKELKANYLHPSDFSGTVLALNEKNGFSAYKDDLGIPTAKDYRDDTLEKSQKSAREAGFWHISAPLDLNPEIPHNSATNFFSLIQHTRITFRDIAEKTGQNSYAYIFYYDKYVINGWQQKTACALFDSFNRSVARLITDTKANKRSSYMATQRQDITQTDITDIFKVSKPMHDRYIIAINKDQSEWNVWTLTHSIDFIRFTETKITPDTTGTIYDSTTFTRVGADILNQELRDFIASEIEHGN
jgi:hypothetical protein